MSLDYLKPNKYSSQYTAGPRPMDVFLKAIPARLVLCLVMAGIVYVTPTFQLEDGSFPLHYYGLLIFVYGVYQVMLSHSYSNQISYTLLPGRFVLHVCLHHGILRPGV